MFRPEDCPELLLRLRPILRLRAIALALRVGLALRATPAALNRKGNIFFMARPPLLCEEGNLLSDAGFVKYVDALTRRGNAATLNRLPIHSHLHTPPLQILQCFAHAQSTQLSPMRMYIAPHLGGIRPCILPERPSNGL